MIEFARNVLGLAGASSAEFEVDAPYKVIDLMPDQRHISDMGGTMRLGQCVCCLTPGSKAERAYGEPIIFERHRHRYEVNNEYRRRAEKAGMLMSGRSADDRLVEIVELKDHPWYVATQFHPEFKSRPTRPHPLFRAFVGASAKNAEHPVTASNGHSAKHTEDALASGTFSKE